MNKNMVNITEDDLIKISVSAINPKELKGDTVGHVSCALLAENGKVYTGVCVGTNSNRYCAERVAIAKMITDSNVFIIKKIVATWKDKKGSLYIVSPCGHCRQAILEVDERNINTEVILDRDKTEKLGDIFPYYDSKKRQQIKKY